MTTPVELLPLPPQWRVHHRRLFIICLAVSGSLTCVFIGMVAWQIYILLDLTGSSATSFGIPLIGLGASASFLYFTYSNLTPRKRDTSCLSAKNISEQETPNLCIPFGKRIVIAFLTLALVMVCGIFGPFVIPNASWGDRVFGISLGVWHILWTISTPVFIWFAWKCNKPAYVALTVDGIHQTTMYYQLFCPWSAIQNLEPAISNQHVWMVRLTFTGTNIPTVKMTSKQKSTWPLWTWEEKTTWDAPAIAYKIDPVLFLEALRYYWKHPEARAELGTPAAVERVQNCRVLDPKPPPGLPGLRRPRE